jgi:hypothetical protein
MASGKAQEGGIDIVLRGIAIGGEKVRGLVKA